MLRTADLLRESKEVLSKHISKEMGKTRREAIAEVEKSAWFFEHYAHEAEVMLHREAVGTEAHMAFIEYEPLGTVLGIMPWNFPFWQVFRFLAPTLMAGKNLKKTVLELGGSNAFIVLDDADIDKAVEIGLKARMQNAGQSCIAAKRFIIHEKVVDEFIDRYATEMKKLKVGDPLDDNTDIGPLSSIEQAEKVKDQVRKSAELGAEIVEGDLPKNAIYPPTLVRNVTQGMPLFDEEVFGPVAPVTTAKDAEEAVKLSNRSKYGLGVSYLPMIWKERKI